MSNVKFEMFTDECLDKIKDKLVAGLYEAAGEVLKQVAQNTPVDTGQLRDSWEMIVDEDEFEAIIGSPLENAIWNEYGTGEFAFNGDGRKGGWVYKDEKGFHHTMGKRPVRSLQNAFVTKKNTVKRILQDKMKEVK